jgi:hypothetical protein
MDRQNSKFSYSSLVNLKEILTSDEELSKLHMYIQEEELRSKLSEKDNKSESPLISNGIHNSYLLDKEKFLNIFLKISSSKLGTKDPVLGKCFDWLRTEIQKTDRNDNNKFNDIKQENQDLYKLISWIEENTKIKFDFDEQKRKKLKSAFNHKLNWIPLSSVKKYIQNAQDDSQYEFINMSEESINNIEEPTFDIFRLESEVGAENTLSTVSCYIFHSMGFYSLIDYSKFDSFIQAITRGYNRENAYHNVKYT